MFTRLKALLRRWLDDTPKAQLHGNTPSTVEEGAAQLVERARQGDQNAVAMICAVRDNAKKGVVQAKQGYAALSAYISKHPMKNPVSFGEELARNRHCDVICQEMTAGFGEDYTGTVKKEVPGIAALSVPKAVVTVANGPNLLQDGACNLFHDVRDSFTESEQKAFILGIKHGLNELDRIPKDLQVPFIVGHVLGTARKIQAVRHPRAPLSILSARLGAEFGELR
jgi:hypothetical protein